MLRKRGRKRRNPPPSRLSQLSVRVKTMARLSRLVVVRRSHAPTPTATAMTALTRGSQDLSPTPWFGIRSQKTPRLRAASACCWLGCFSPLMVGLLRPVVGWAASARCWLGCFGPLLVGLLRPVVRLLRPVVRLLRPVVGLAASAWLSCFGGLPRPMS